MKLKNYLLAMPLAIAAASVTAVETADWTGPYAGGSLNLTTFTTETSDYWCWYACDAPGTVAQDITLSLNGGYDWQLNGGLVLGVELDYSTGLDEEENIRWNGGVRGADWTDELNNVISLRGRMGVAVNQSLLYVTAGFSQADVSHKAQEVDQSDPNVYTAEYDDTVSGYVFGAGVEHMLTDAVSLKAEYTVSQYESTGGECWKRTNDPTSVCNPGENDDAVHWKSTVDMFKIGANYRF